MEWLIVSDRSLCDSIRQCPCTGRFRQRSRTVSDSFYTTIIGRTTFNSRPPSHRRWNTAAGSVAIAPTVAAAPSLTTNDRMLLGVTCSVPWDAAPTNEKPRSGQLYSSREKICEALGRLRTTSTSRLRLPPSSLPSVDNSSSSTSTGDVSSSAQNNAFEQETETAGTFQHAFLDSFEGG